MLSHLHLLSSSSAAFPGISRHQAWKQSGLLSPLCHQSPCPPASSSSLSRRVSSCFIPDWQRSQTHYDARVFCSSFSRDGLSYLIATQDHTVHLYHTHSLSSSSESALPFKQIRARRGGWSIVDTDYSPDSRHIVYSSWSPSVQLCNVHGEYELHESLDMEPTVSRVCFFSVKFSPDGLLLLAGSNESCLYLLDIERKQRLLCLPGHDDDINSVCFADQSGNLFLTASDDTTIRLWDLRTLSSAFPDSGPSTLPSRSHSRHHAAVGSFCGHEQGITHVESAGDGRLFCSNGKDQSIRLWDSRRTATAAQAASIGQTQRGAFDYRWESYSQSSSNSAAVDCSVAAYRGHRVFETLIRCHFSPAATGRRFIYTGSHAREGGWGEVVVYDTLTGEIVRRLRGHRGIVRDCSWHPTEALMLTASWDQSVGRWELGQEMEATTAETEADDSQPTAQQHEPRQEGETSRPEQDDRQGEEGQGEEDADEVEMKEVEYHQLQSETEDAADAAEEEGKENEDGRALDAGSGSIDHTEPASHSAAHFASGK